MNYTTTTHNISGITINRIVVPETKWITVYDSIKREIKIPPTEINKSTIVTKFDYIIADSENDLILAMSGISNYIPSIIDQAIKDIEDYSGN